MTVVYYTPTLLIKTLFPKSLKLNNLKSLKLNNLMSLKVNNLKSLKLNKLKSLKLNNPCVRLLLPHKCSNSIKLPWWGLNLWLFPCEPNALTTWLKVQEYRSSPHDQAPLHSTLTNRGHSTNVASFLGTVGIKLTT